MNLRRMEGVRRCSKRKTFGSGGGASGTTTLPRRDAEQPEAAWLAAVCSLDGNSVPYLATKHSEPQGRGRETTLWECRSEVPASDIFQSYSAPFQLPRCILDPR